MVKAIIFDIGGVILDMKPLSKQAIKIFQPPDKINFWTEINIEAVPLCKGEITVLEFWKRIAKRYKKKIPDETLKYLWIKDYEKLTSINLQVQKLAESLKKHYRLGIISNTIPEHTKINKKRGIFGLYDVVILSHEARVTKENREIFLRAAVKLGVKAEECIFIDDVQKFVDVAQSVGMRAILYSNPVQLKESLKSFSVKID